MKVFLVQLPNVTTETEVRYMQPYLAVGLGILASVLRDDGHQVRLLDAYTEGWDNRARIEGDWIEIGLGEEEIAAQIRRFQPQVVGFSLPFTSQMPRLRSLARWVKAIHPEIYVVCGGNHPTCVPHEILTIPEVDAVVLGEGERSFSRLLQALEVDQSFDDLPGLAYRSKSSGVIVNPAEIINDLDALPSPAYDLLPLKSYFRAVGARKIPLFASRGCTQSCASCSQPLMYPGPVRRFSPDYLSRCLRHLVEFYGVREFIFEDDGLTSEVSEATRLFDCLIAENLRISWTTRGCLNPEALDSDLLAKMRLAGGKSLRFAVGSGSRRVLHQILNKKMDLYILEETLKRAQENEFVVSCEFLLGSPGTTIEEVYETLKFAWKLRSKGVEKFSFLLSTPYVGTGLRQQALEMGLPVPPSNPDFLPHRNLVAAQDPIAMEIAQIREVAQREFNSRGLVLELGRLVGVGAKSAPKVEERIFASVAPWPVLKVAQPPSREREAASREPG